MSTKTMNRNTGSPFKLLSDKYFELLLILMVLSSTLIIQYFVSVKHVMLHFYYFPVVIAAHYFGRRMACATAMFGFLSVAIFSMMDPQGYANMATTKTGVLLTICVWGGFLGLNSILFGTLCDQRAANIKELRNAHIGIIEILSKYLQAADHYTKSHSMRVAELAEAIGERMRLTSAQLEDIRVGALLHDIGKIEISTQLIQKAAGLSEEEQGEMATHTFRGAELIGSLGSILEGAIPVIQHHHDHYTAESKAEGKHGDQIPLGARIVSVADAYDAIVTDRPYRRGRTPQEAITVIRECAGTQFDPAVVDAFEQVMVDRLNEEDGAREELARNDAALNIEIPPPADQPKEETTV